MKEFDREKYINEHIPYRMQSIDFFNKLIHFNQNHDGPQEMKVIIEDQLRFEGNHYGLTNPTVEIGIMYCRALLEFCGIGTNNDKTKLCPIKHKRKDSVYVCDFEYQGECLPLVTPSEVLDLYEGEKDAAEQALVAVIVHAHKSVAHLTLGPEPNSYSLDDLEIASRGLPKIVCQFFYNRIKRPHPSYAIRQSPSS